MNITLLFLIAVIFLVMIASTVEMVQAVNKSDDPSTAPRKHKAGDKFSRAKICGLQICR